MKVEFKRKLNQVSMNEMHFGKKYYIIPSHELLCVRKTDGKKCIVDLETGWEQYDSTLLFTPINPTPLKLVKLADVPVGSWVKFPDINTCIYCVVYCNFDMGKTLIQQSGLYAEPRWSAMVEVLDTTLTVH